MYIFEDEIAVNNYICIELRNKGIPTNMGNRAKLIKQLSNEFDCDMFIKVAAYYEVKY